MALCYLQISWKRVWSYPHGRVNQLVLTEKLVAKKTLTFSVCVGVHECGYHNLLLTHPSSNQAGPTPHLIIRVGPSSHVWPHDVTFSSRIWD